MPGDEPDQYRIRLVDPLLDELLKQLPGVMVGGPRGAGKTTTLGRRATTIVRLDSEARTPAFEADPDAALRALREPVLLDEWQEVPGVLGAVRRAIDNEWHPDRFYLTGSALAEESRSVYPGTGRIHPIEMYPMTVREQQGDVSKPTIFDLLVAEGELPPPESRPDLLGYVELAIKGGFPAPALRVEGAAREAWLEGYVRNLLTHDVEQLDSHRSGPKRDPEQLRAYFEACCLSSAGVSIQKTINDAAGVAKETGASYERLLTRLYAIEALPAWTSNRLKRLMRRPKRYVVDSSLIPAALRLDAAGVVGDGDLLGRMIETFVVAQLRPEVAVSRCKPRLFHLRTGGGRQEIDVLAELGGGRLIGFEIKASAAPRKDHARHLAWLRDELGEKFVAGVVFHTGPDTFTLGERITAAPIASIWS